MKKRTRFLLPILIIQLLFSCQNKPKSKYEKLILGEWKQVIVPQKIEVGRNGRVVLELPRDSVVMGYDFFENNECESKTGFYTIIPKRRETSGARVFLGTETQYKIEDDSLKVYSRSVGRWLSMKIESITSDTLRLRSVENTLVKFVRTDYAGNKRLEYDRIVVSTSGCLGSCPVNTTLVASDGEVLYKGEMYNTKEGLYTSKIPSSRFRKIEQDFLKANLSALKEDYSADWTDDETVTLSFIRKGKITKTVEDYGRSGPTELFWAYTPLRYLYQSLELDTINNLPAELGIEVTGFSYSNKISDLKETESFYLWSLLRSGRATSASFHKKYDLVFSGPGQLLRIETDGRFYHFIWRNGREKSVDIGFNFVKENAAIMHFRKKNEYDRGNRVSKF